MVGDYPWGAKEDSRAPYNEGWLQHVECQRCEGTGNVSECCGAPVLSINGEYKCTNCGDFCDIYHCKHCDGEGWLIIREDEY